MGESVADIRNSLAIMRKRWPRHETESQEQHERLVQHHRSQESKRLRALKKAVEAAKSEWEHGGRKGRRKSKRKRIRPDTMEAMLSNAGSYKPMNALGAIEGVWGEGMPRAAAGQIRNAAIRLVRGRSHHARHRGGGTRRRRRHNRRTRRRRRH